MHQASTDDLSILQGSELLPETDQRRHQSMQSQQSRHAQATLCGDFLETGKPQAQAPQDGLLYQAEVTIRPMRYLA